MDDEGGFYSWRSDASYPVSGDGRYWMAVSTRRIARSGIANSVNDGKRLAERSASQVLIHIEPFALGRIDASPSHAHPGPTWGDHVSVSASEGAVAECTPRLDCRGLVHRVFPSRAVVLMAAEDEAEVEQVSSCPSYEPLC